MSRKRTTLFIYLAGACILTLVAAFQLLGVSADHPHYLEYISDPQSRTGTEELSFSFILLVTSLFPTLQTTLLFIIYAVLGVGIKLYVFFKKSKLPLLTLILYIPSYFLLHEYVQIRAAIAVGIFLLALDDIKNRNIKGYLIKSLLAMCFHWSSAIMIPLYLLSKPIKWPLLVALPLFGLLLNFAQVAPYFAAFSSNDGGIGFVQAYYALHAGHFASINVFNSFSLFQIVLFGVFIHVSARKQSDPDFRYAFFPLIEIFSISLFCFFLFSALELPVVAFRINEFFNSVLFLLIPITIIKIKKKLSLAVFSTFYYLSYCLHLFLNTHIIPDLNFFRP